MKAPPKADDVQEIRPEQLLEADGFLFGFPSRFGVMAAQFKAFFDATSEIWQSQALAGKPAGIFWSTGFHGGGQELTAAISFLNQNFGSQFSSPLPFVHQHDYHYETEGPVCEIAQEDWVKLHTISYHIWLTAITQLAHHGMIFVPVGYTFGSGMMEMSEVKGGSPYGAGTYAADGTRQPTELELQQAFYQGKYVAELTKKLKN
ncbi:probable NAD(P)H dehydrogenase (quinone) FQR1-like 3 isoform X4 [Momordica charantia]|nr:probable NAD(P)H dehydrogenase (quinone) FQR1-like 3 isoform X4 [Momordica charantia]